MHMQRFEATPPLDKLSWARRRAAQAAASVGAFAGAGRGDLLARAGRLLDRLAGHRCQVGEPLEAVALRLLALQARPLSAPIPAAGRLPARACPAFRTSALGRAPRSGERHACAERLTGSAGRSASARAAQPGCPRRPSLLQAERCTSSCPAMATAAVSASSSSTNTSP